MDEETLVSVADKRDDPRKMFLDTKQPLFILSLVFPCTIQKIKDRLKCQVIIATLADDS
jgi:hypothetical protein